jgi:putative component of membrane protein insertase Oxa1/YidC/SpoIIIJ protein YidD
MILFSWGFRLLIRLYWILIPNAIKGQCLFRETCSRFVYRKVKEEGFWAGLNALKYRYKTCRSPFSLQTNPNNGKWELELCNGDVIQEQEIGEVHLNVVRSATET